MWHTPFNNIHVASDISSEGGHLLECLLRGGHTKGGSPAQADFYNLSCPNFTSLHSFELFIRL